MHYHFAPRDEKAWRVNLAGLGKGRNGREIEENNTRKGKWKRQQRRVNCNKELLKTIKLFSRFSSRNRCLLFGCFNIDGRGGWNRGRERKRDGHYRAVKEGDGEMCEMETRGRGKCTIRDNYA